MNTITFQRTKPDSLYGEATSRYEGMSELELIQLCQERNPKAFEHLVKRYERNVFGLLYRLAPEFRDTSDLAQEVFIRLWVSIGKLRNPYSFRTWLNQITTNVFYDELRRRRIATISISSVRYMDEGEDDREMQIADPSASPDQLVEQTELNHEMELSLLRMSKSSRRMIVLRDVEGLSYREISDVTAASMGTVKSRIARARAKMRRILSPYLFDVDATNRKVSA